MSDRSSGKMKVAPQHQHRTIFKWVGAVGAIAASIAAFSTNIQTIKEVFVKFWPPNDSSQVNVGWITIPDPADLTCIASKTRRFELSKGHIVSLLENDCLSELIQRAGVSSKGQKQTIGKSFFLLLENRGPRIDGVELLDVRSNEGVVTRVSAIDPGTSVAVCMGFEGRSGHTSREFKLREVRIISRGGRPPTVVAIHDPKRSTGYAISDCGNFTYSYPGQP